MRGQLASQPIRLLYFCDVYSSSGQTESVCYCCTSVLVVLNPLTFYASEESANINIEDKRHRPRNIASEEAGGMISNHFLHSPKSEQCSATSYKVHNSNL